MAGKWVDVETSEAAGWVDVETPVEERIDPTDDMSGLERVLAGIGRGFVDIGQGAKQIGLQVGEKVGLTDPGTYDAYTQKIQEEEELYDKPLLDTTGGKVGRFVGNVAATAPIPGGAVGKVIPRILAGAAAGGVSAGLMPTKEGESRLKNMGIGAATGGVATGLMAAGGKAISGLRGDKSAAVSQDLAQQARNFGVPLTVGELRQNPAFQRIEQMLERVPLVGTLGFREKQATQLSRAAQALADNYGAGITDVGEELQSSLARTLARNKTEATRLYDAVGQAAQGAQGKVELNNLKQTVQQIAGREGVLPEVIQDSKILSAVAKYGELEDMPFDVARVVRSRLGQELRRVEKQAVSGSVSDEEVAAIRLIRGALERDLDDFAAREGGDIGRMYREANAFYRTNVVPFKDRMIRKAGSEDFDTDQIIKTFIKNDRPQLAAKLMGRLDQNGQAAVKFAILKDAFENASEGKTPFSPAKFAQRLEKLGKSKNTIFDAQERQQIEGFTRLARAAERAGQYAENPPTGQRVLDAAIGAGSITGAWFNPGAVAFGAGASATFSKLLTSNTGRSILTRAAGIPPQSQAMQRLLTVDLPRALAIGTGGNNASDKQ